MYTQGQNDLDARTREYEAAKQALAEHHTNHENAARCAATLLMDALMERAGARRSLKVYKEVPQGCMVESWVSAKKPMGNQRGGSA